MRLLILTIFASFTLVNGVRVNVDTSGARDLAGFGRMVKARLEDYYPTMVRLLRSPTFQDVSTINVRFDPSGGNWVANANWRTRNIVGRAGFYRDNQNNHHGDGSMIHEMAHIVQQYRNCDSWVTEGIADWVRYYHYQPRYRPSKPRRDQHFRRNQYEVAAYFLNWINQRYRGMIYYLNKDCREGTYRENIFSRLTGKTVDQLWNEMLNS